MSSYGQPPPFDPALYEPPLKDRPTSVTVLAIIGIIYAVLGMIYGGLAVAVGAVNLSAGRNVLAFSKAPMAYSQSLTAAGVVIGAVALVLAIALMVGCIGALYLRPWALRVVRLWAVFYLLCGIAQMVLSLTWLGPEQLRIMKESQPNNPAFNQAPGFMNTVMIATTVFALVFSSILPICFLALWRRSEVKEAFAGDGADMPGLELPRQQ